MPDLMEHIGQSLIQHGKFNNRIYLMKLARDWFPEIIDELEIIAKNMGYTKVFTKIPVWAVWEFKQKDFVQEAMIPRFFNGEGEVFFYSKFYDEKRARLDPEEEAVIQKNIALAQAKANHESVDWGAPPFEIRKLEEPDAEALADIYKEVFKTYPFPIHDPEFLKEMMRDTVIYFGAFEEDRLIAASSAEMDKEHRNAEMTDFATRPSHRGHGIAVHLLARMEEEMRALNMPTVYTIARAMSPGMNITFSKMGYLFSGTLVHNTQISGTIESMNVWHKSLD